MKKLFLFATIAAAGLFASCSSTDDAISDAANSGIEGAENAPQAIQVGIGNLGITTRGTGTIGGIENHTEATDPEHVWAGQRINVYMFKKDDVVENSVLTGYKSTLKIAQSDGKDLYNNTEMITPGSAENLITNPQVYGATWDNNVGQAMIATGAIQYYPNEGCFDFFGYHGDDAVAANAGLTPIKYDDQDAVTTTEADVVKWTVPFTIDGSQDLMSARAELTADQKTMMDSKSGANKQRFYSAYSARQATPVQPVLTFNHLLTRLAFKVKAGAKSATGWVDAIPEVTDAEARAYNEGLTDALKYSTNQNPDVAYNFTARLTSEINATGADLHWETAGIVKKLGEQGEYTIVQVVKNVPGDPNAAPDPNNNAFLGLKFAVHATDLSTLDESVGFALYGVDGDVSPYTISPTASDFSVKTLSETTDDQKAAFNATLAGAKHASAAIPAHQDFAKAVKVTKIEIESKTTGEMAVAWLEPETEADAYQYSMGMISVATYNTAAAVTQSNWAPVYDDPNAQNPIIIAYKWASDGNINKTAYEALTAAEKAAATCVNGPMSDGKKIAFTDAEEWLPLKERPYAKQNTALVYTDFTEYNALVAARDAITDQTSAEYTAAANAVTAKETELAALLNQTLISQTFYNRLVADDLGTTDPEGKAKYDELTGKLPLNEKLIALSPTVPEYDTTAATEDAKLKKTPVGEALIVAPSPYDYKMKVTIEQDVPTNWNTPTERETKTHTYDLTITAPNGNFAVNTSYDIILTVYSFERIEVHTVITPWDNAADPINIGADE